MVKRRPETNFYGRTLIRVQGRCGGQQFEESLQGLKILHLGFFVFFLVGLEEKDVVQLNIINLARESMPVHHREGEEKLTRNQVRSFAIGFEHE